MTPVEIDRPAGPQAPPDDEVFLFPASFAQRRIWFLEQLGPGRARYGIPWALRIEGRLAPALLARLLTAIVARHEVLRTTFSLDGDELLQVISPVPEVALPVVSLDGLDAARREAELLRLAALHARWRFDLERGPLVATVLVSLAPRTRALLANLHHIVGDRWSVDVLVGELGALYRAWQTGGERSMPEALPELELQYADFAQAQLDWFEDDILEAELAHWRACLSGAEPPELPLDRPRRPAAGTEAVRGVATAVARLAPSVTADLEALATGAHATLFMALVTAVQALLGRISRPAGPVPVGTVVAGRTHVASQEMIGCFVNTLVLATDLAGRPGFREALERTRRTAIDAFAHQELPYDRLVEELAPGRDLERTPLFDVLVTLADDGSPVLELGDLVLSPVEIAPVSAKFDWSISGTRRDGGLDLELVYRADLFDAGTVDRALGALVRLIEAAVEAPERPFDALPLVTDAERAELLAAGTGRGGSRLAARSVDGLVLDRLREAPEAEALAWEGGSWTGAELARRAVALAGRLRATGVGAGGEETIVGLLLGRAPEQVVAVLAVLAAGGAFLPLDPAEPVERSRRAADVAGARVLVGERAVAEELGLAVGRSVVEIGETDGATTEAGEPLTDPARLAYVLTTSGSTGRPKPVAVSHGAFLHHLAWVTAAHPLAPGSTAVAKTPLGFDVGVRELLWPLATGARLVLAPPDAHRDPAALARLVRREHPAVLAAVPSLLGALLEALDAEAMGDAAEGAGGAVDGSAPWAGRLLAGGEALPPSIARRALRVRGRELFNQYGPTETAVTATVERVTEPVAEPVPIGRPIAGARVLVVDDRLGLQPWGAFGEIVIGGGGLARGYAGQPARTAERFVPDPWSEGPGARLYRSGDLGRLLADGRILFAGRLDAQIQVRGLRVELEEVEAVVAAHPAVAECAVVPVGRTAAGSYERLVAWVVPRGLPSAADEPADELSGTSVTGAKSDSYGDSSGVPDASGEQLEVDVSALAARCREHLPAPAVPSLFVPVGELPRTPSGKLDRRTVASWQVPAGQLQVASADPARPADPLAEVVELLAGLWAEVLDVAADRVGPESDFFRLGGHSLQAARLAARVRGRLGVELPLAVLFDRPTPSGVAGWLVGHRAGAPGLAAPPPLEPVVPRPARVPLTFGQERLWFLSRLAPGSPRYQIPFALELAGRLETARLARALAGVVARHEVLRTRYLETDEGPVQVVDPPDAAALPVVDLSSLPAESAEAEALGHRRTAARRPFDLAARPVVRSLLVRRGATLHELLVTVHHIASDGWSTHLLVEDLAALYRGRHLVPLPLQVADVALWQRRWLTGVALDERLAGWRRLLDGATDPLELPLDRPRRPVGAPDEADAVSHRGAVTVPVRLSAETVAGLDRLVRQRGATRFVAVTALFATLLGRWSGQLAFSLGAPVAGRTRLETERLVGFFVNTLVLPVDRTDDPCAAVLVSRLRDRLLDALALQDLPFERLVAELAPGGERSGRGPLVQAAVTFQNTPAGTLELPGLALRPVETSTDTVRFDLSLALADRGGDELSGSLSADGRLFDRATVERLARGLEGLMAAAVAAPAVALDTLPLVSEPERQELLGPASGAGVAVPGAGLTLLDLVASRAARSPEATALVVPAPETGGEDRRISHRELLAAAREVAERLVAAGVVRGDRVALMAPRSPELLAGVLGIFAAGAAFVPVPPEDPPERSRFVLRDAGVRVALMADGGELARGRAELAALDLVPLVAVAAAGGWADAAPSPPGLARSATGGDDLAYVLYTSGSTGRPKGVLMHHRGAVAHVLWAVERYRASAAEPALWKTSLVFDPVLREIFGPLHVGAPVVVAPPGAEGDPARLLELVRRYGVTTLSMVPSLLATALDTLADAGGGDLGPLRRILSDGERLPASVARRTLALLAAGGGDAVGLTNHLGPTETAVTSTWHDLAVGRAVPERVPVGRPAAGHTVYLGDQRGELVPPGAAGELLIGGVGVARGYQGRPALTAERFVPDRFGGEPGGRLYRTGDLLRRSPSTGELDFLGRIDRQLKLRGVRVEPGEIEAVLASHPAVAEAAVAVVEASLVALVVPAAPGADGSKEIDPGALVAHARRYLAEALVPAVVAPLGSLPRTGGGKLDRRCLSEAAAAALAKSRRERVVVLPRDATERAVAAVWCALLGLERVGVDQGFFSLGGHSLLLTRVRGRLARELGVELPLAALFTAPTVAGMAAAIARERERSAATAEREGGGDEATLDRPEPAAGGFAVRAVSRRGRRVSRQELERMSDGDRAAEKERRE